MKKITFMNGDVLRCDDLLINDRTRIATVITPAGEDLIPMETIREIEDEPGHQGESIAAILTRRITRGDFRPVTYVGAKLRCPVDQSFCPCREDTCPKGCAKFPEDQAAKEEDPCGGVRCDECHIGGCERDQA